MTAFRFHQRRVRRSWYAGATVVAAALFIVFMVAGASATTGTPVAGSPSNFESGDGNTILSTSGNTDWNCFTGTDSFSSATIGGAGSSFTKANCKTTSGAAAAAADQAGEITWVPGQKYDNQCPQLTTGSVPNKDDFTHIAQFLETAGPADTFPGDVYFYGAAERLVANGSSSGNVEFNQLTATVPGCAASDGTTSAGPRTLGDKLVGYDFNNGGTALAFRVLTYITCASSTLACGTAGGNAGTCFVAKAPPCWGAHEFDTSSGTTLNGSSNQAAIQAADNAVGGDSQAVNQFAEFGVNLTLALTGQHAADGGKLPCFPQQVWESRSSGPSFSSNPEDIEFEHASTCGNITIVKNTLNGAGNRSGVNQDFSYSTTGGLSPSTFTLNDATGTDVNCSTSAAPCNEQPYLSTSVGTYSVTEGAAPTNFKFVSVNCVNNGTGSGTFSKSGQAVTINLKANDDWVCTYVNQQQLGALKITKVSSKTAATPLSGATFSITGPGGYSNSVTTGSDGTVCVDHLTFGTYHVTETAAPTGYSIDDTTTHDVAVNTNATCGSGNEATFKATDTPLTDIAASATSEVAGGTKSTVTCTGTSTDGKTTLNSSDGPKESASVSATKLHPGTYTCTIVIDP